MQASIFTQYLLPLALAFIMFGMGLSLIKADFTRLLYAPKAVIIGLFGQLILMPLIAFLIASFLGLSAELAIGLMILAACPGGTTSNVISQLTRANLALSVTLTGFATLICVFSTPWLIEFAINQFGQETHVQFSLADTSLGLVCITLVPVLMGIWVRSRWEMAAVRKEVHFRRFSLLFMIAMIIAVVIQERATLVDYFQQVFLAALLLNLGSIALGVLIAKLAGLDRRDQTTLGIEVGIQNASLAILIAVTYLHNSEYATTAGVYGLTMYIGAAALVLWTRLTSKPTH
ncbi:MAG: bile acid:sodium symporter family protein [Aestuariibacter sp.]